MNGAKRFFSLSQIDSLSDDLSPFTQCLSSAKPRTIAFRKTFTYSAWLWFMAYRGSIALFILLCCFTSAWCLDPGKNIAYYNIQSYSIEQGLPQNSVLSIKQTSDGYLWIATQEGLGRFDGYQFKVIDRTTSNVLLSNHIEVLLPSVDGVSLYLGTFKGLYVLRVDQISLVHSELADSEVMSLCEDRRGCLWIGTRRDGLFSFHNGRLDTHRDIPRGVPASVISAIVEDQDGILWVGTMDRSLFRRENGAFHAVSGLNDEEDRPIIRSLFVDSTGKLWIGTANRGLITLKNTEIVRLTAQDGILHNVISQVIEDREGTIWVGTFGGLNRIRGNVIDGFARTHGLAYSLIISLCEDHERNLWIGTSGGGLYCLRDGKFITISKATGLSADDVYSVTDDGDDGVWIATSGGGINHFTSDGIDIFTMADGLNDDNIYALLRDRHGDIWAGGPRGVNRIRQGRIERPLPEECLKNQEVIALFEDRSGRLWFGTEEDGVTCLDGSTWKSWNTDSGLSDNMVQAIHEDLQGRIWLGTDGGGITLIQGERLEIIGSDQGLSSMMIMAFYQDADGYLWIGTYGGGLMLYHNDVFSVFTTEDGLFNDSLFYITGDDDNHLWLSCNKGVFKVSRLALLDYQRESSQPLKCTVFGTMDGLKSSECNGGVQPSGLRSPDGRIWIPTTRGLSVIDPGNVHRNLQPPPVVIEQFIVDGRSQSRNDSFVLLPGKRNFEFHYTGLSFASPEKVMFKYRLVGYDKAWVDAGARRAAYYTNIPPGRYTFRVIASNSDGIWNVEGASISFTHQAYFYQTILFYVLCALLAFSLVVVLVRMRIDRMTRRQIDLQKNIDERTCDLQAVNDQLEETNRELQRLSSLDGLTGIPNRRYIDSVMHREWSVCRRLKLAFAVIMIDIDFFKSFNDHHGHQAGDECLRAVARTLAQPVEGIRSIAARYGGEEFLVFLFNTPEKEAANVADMLRLKIEAISIQHPTSTVGDVLTISCGVAAIVPGPVDSIENLLKSADRALYTAKNSGRNRVCVASMND